MNDVAAMETLSKVDFVSGLPPEVVLNIVFHLELEDVVNCLLVCHSWRCVLSGLEPFWRQACFRFGLSEAVIRRLMPSYSSSKALLLAAKRHRDLLYTTPPRLSTITEGCPYNVHRVCKYAKGEDMVSVIYQDFRPCQILVEALQHSSVQQTLSIQLSVYRTSENRIVWSHLFHDFLYCATACGLWSVHYIRMSRIPLLEWKSEPLYEPNQRIGCCSVCHMVCTCKLVYCHNQEPYWDVRVISVDEQAALECMDLKRSAKYRKSDLQTIVKFKLRATNTGITARQSNHAMKKVTLLPRTSSEKDPKGRCLSHWLLLQWANVISAHHLASDGGRTLTSTSPESEYIVPCELKHIKLAVVHKHGLNSEFEMSSDGKIIGMLFQSHLIVWDVESAKEVSFAEIVLDNYNYEQMRLIALGHIYSIIGLEFTNVLLVVANSTGETVLKCVDFARKHCTILSPYIEFLTAVRTDWLSDIASPCTRDRPAVTFWNKTNRSVEGIYFGRAPNPKAVGEPLIAKRKRAWWQRK